MELGLMYRDTVTGFEGMATSRAEYLHGGPRVMLEAIRGDKEVSRWYDETRVVCATPKNV